MGESALLRHWMVRSKAMAWLHLLIADCYMCITLHPGTCPLSEHWLIPMIRSGTLHSSSEPDADVHLATCTSMAKPSCPL